MNIENNGVTQKQTIPYNWSMANLETLRRVTEEFAVPAFVYPGRGTLKINRQIMSDDDVEATIRFWVWDHCYLTGENIPAMPHPDELRGEKILQWRLENGALNNSNGPAMACGTISNLYVSLLAAQGILARKVCVTRADGAADNSAEYWSPRRNGWVHVIPHCNAHFVGKDGDGLSFYRWASMEKRFGRDMNVSLRARGTPAASKLLGITFDGYTGYHASATVENNNAYHAETNPSGPYHLIQVFDDPSIPNRQVGDTAPATFRDIEPAGNALLVTFEDGIAQLSTDMPNFKEFHYCDRIGWKETKDDWFQVLKPTLFRAVGTSGQTSQTVLVNP